VKTIQAIVTSWSLFWLAISVASPAVGEELTIAERWTGTYSGIKTASERVIRDTGTWAKLWIQLHSIQSPVPPVPKVDFDNQIVLAVFLGEQRTGGYSIRITKLKSTDTHIEVHVERTAPPPQNDVTTALTQPYDIAVIAKPDKPVKFVSEAR